MHPRAQKWELIWKLDRNLYIYVCSIYTHTCMCVCMCVHMQKVCVYIYHIGSKKKVCKCTYIIYILSDIHKKLHILWYTKTRLKLYFLFYLLLCDSMPKTFRTFSVNDYIYYSSISFSYFFCLELKITLDVKV